MKRPKSLGLCVICGQRDAVTRDNVPPGGIFPPPRPSDLVRVPACRPCNNGTSALDERFRVYLGLHVSRFGGRATRLYEEARRSLRHNRRLRREVLASVRPAHLATDHGVIYERGFRILWDSQAHDTIVEKTIRGLYYHHFHDILGPRVKVDVYWFRSLSKELAEMSNVWLANRVGQGDFIYRFGRAEDSPLDSVWIFEFYGAHWAAGYTSPFEKQPNITFDPTAALPRPPGSVDARGST